MLIQVINAGPINAMYKLAVDAADVRRRHPLVLPPPGSGLVFQPLAFKQLRLGEAARTAWSCALKCGPARARPQRWGASGKRKNPPRTNGRKATVAKGGTGSGGVGRAPSKSRPATLGILPANACRYAWSGDDCPKPACPFDHH